MVAAVLSISGILVVLGFAACCRLLLKHLRIRRFITTYHPGVSDTPKHHKVLMIMPSIDRKDGAVVKQKLLMLPGITLAILAALTPDDWDVEIVLETIERVPFDTDADLIAISCMGLGMMRGLRMAERFHERGKKVVLGGLMATLNPEYALENGADVVCRGDAEGVWETILRDFEKDRMKRIYEGYDTSTLSWPVPRYDLLARKRVGWVLPVMTGRGCPHRCEFCSIAAAYKGQYSRRSIDQVVRDIGAIKSLGFKRVLVLDDNIAADADHAVQLFSEIEKLNVKWIGQCALYIADHEEMLKAAVRSGCTALSFGLESIHQENLSAMDKTFGKVAEYEQSLRKIRDAGIIVAGEFMFGLDGDRAETFKKTAEFVLRNRITLPKFHVLTLVPGTPLYDRYEREGRIIDRDFGHYDITTAVFEPENISRQELERGFWQLSDDVFTYRAILSRVTKSTARNTLFHRLLFLIVNLHYRQYVKKRIATGIF